MSKVEENSVREVVPMSGSVDDWGKVLLTISEKITIASNTVTPGRKWVVLVGKLLN